MPGVKSIFAKVGNMMGAKVPSAVKGSPSQKAGLVPPKAGTPGDTGASGSPGVKKAFDFNMYMKAVQLFFKDFFGKKVPYFFRNMGPVLKQAPVWWGALPQDEQISYGVLALGNFMVLVGIVLIIVI